MNERSKIKIVKKGEISTLKVRKRKRDIPRDAAREMVTTVSDWVADFKTRKSAETKAAFDIFSASNPRPNES
ncbi:MAG: hypothetical protein ACKVRN_14795 [Pyrinomonadaceae bacterium]